MLVPSTDFIENLNIDYECTTPSFSYLGYLNPSFVSESLGQNILFTYASSITIDKGD